MSLFFNGFLCGALMSYGFTIFLVKAACHKLGDELRKEGKLLP